MREGEDDKTPAGEPSAPPPPPPGRRTAEEIRRAKLEEDEIARLDREIDEVESFRMPLMEHLIELKDRIVRSLIALTLGACLGLYFSTEFFDFLRTPFLEAASHSGLAVPPRLVGIGLYEGMTVYFKVAFIVAVLFASPVLSWQVWSFIAPGLYKSERSAVVPLAVTSYALFVIGAAFCYYMLLPLAFPFFFTAMPGTDVTVSIDDYLSSVLQMILAFGAAFQMPIVAFFAARLGFIDHKDLVAGFRYAVVGIAVVAAILTPPDVISQMLLMAPMTVLYGVSIAVARVFTTKQR